MLIMREKEAREIINLKCSDLLHDQLCDCQDKDPFKVSHAKGFLEGLEQGRKEESVKASNLVSRLEESRRRIDDGYYIEDGAIILDWIYDDLGRALKQYRQEFARRKGEQKGEEMKRKLNDKARRNTE